MTGADLRRALPVVCMVAVGAVYAFTRLVGLDHSFWEDEAITAATYGDPGPSAIFDPDTYRLNNHVLYSLAAWAFTSLAGASEVAYRLVAVVPATAAAALVTAWVWRRRGAPAGCLVAFLVTVAPVHFALSRQARGYGLAFLSAAVMLIVAVRLSEDPTRRRRELPLFGLAAVVGTCTLSAMALLVALHAAVLMAARPLRRGVAVTVAAAGAVTLAFYAPLLGKILRQSTAVGHDLRGSTVSFQRVLVDPVDRLLSTVVELAVDHSALALTVAVLLVAAGTAGLVAERRERWLAAHLALPLVGYSVALALRGTRIWDRYVSFLAFHALVLMALGIVVLVARARGRWRPPALVALGAFVAATAWGFAGPARDRLAEPVENFKAATDLVDTSRPRGPVYLPTGAPLPELDYYLDRPLIRVPDAQFVRLSCRADGPAVFIEYPRRRGPVDVRCLRRRAVRVEFAQRKDPPIVLWFLRAAPSGTPDDAELVGETPGVDRQ